MTTSDTDDPAGAPAEDAATEPAGDRPAALTATPTAGAGSLRARRIPELLRRYAILIMLAVLFLVLTFTSDAFLSQRNLLNILNQNAPLAIIAAAGTLVIIAGGFDLSTGSIFGVAAVCSAWVAANVDPILGLLCAPLIGVGLGIVNGLVVTLLRVHAFLATLATGLVYRGLAILITGGFFISVSRLDSFRVLGRDRIGAVHVAVLVFVAFSLLLSFILNRTVLGRYIFAVGGNEEAAELSGVRVARVKIATFAFSGLAAGIAGAIQVSRIGSGQPQAGEGFELQAIAAVILGGTSIYGGVGAVWRSVAGVYLLALVTNGFNILDANPFYKDLTTGLIIVAAVALSAADRRR